MFGTLLGSMGHKLKIHKITPPTGKEHGDIEMKDYVVLPRGQDNCLLHPIISGQISNTRHPETVKADSVFKNETRSKNFHYRKLYLDLPDPIVFLPLAVNTSGRLYDDAQMTSFVCSSCTINVRYLSLSINYRRNRISFDFFVLLDWLISNQGSV